MLTNGVAAGSRASTNGFRDFYDACEDLLEPGMRQLEFADFEKALETYRPSNVHSQEYRAQQVHAGQVGPSLCSFPVCPTLPSPSRFHRPFRRRIAHPKVLRACVHACYVLVCGRCGNPRSHSAMADETRGEGDGTSLSTMAVFRVAWWSVAPWAFFQAAKRERMSVPCLQVAPEQMMNTFATFLNFIAAAGTNGANGANGGNNGRAA